MRGSEDVLEGTFFDASVDASGRFDMERVQLERGGTLDRYILIERVGAGGMGVVWAAYDPDLDRKVALKLLSPRHAGGSKARARLKREAQTMACLRHPNVTAIHAVGEFDGDVYLAMDLIEGRTLGRWVRASARDWEEIVDMFIQAGRGLVAAHQAGIVHRDFKPDNVLVGGGRARVTDFGLARALQEQEGEEPAEERSQAEGGSSEPSGPVTRTGAMLGTPAYMAPEQFAGAQLDARSDQFSFCVALWEALYGQRPFAGTSVDQLRETVQAGRISAPSHDTRKVPAQLERALRRGMAVDPAQRWPSMEALLTALERRPGASWKRVGLGTGALLACFGLAYLLGPSFGPERAGERGVETAPSCEFASRQLGELWPAAHAEALREGFAHAEMDPALAAELHAGLRAYAERWLGLVHGLCTLEGEGVAVRAHCLARHEIAFEVRRNLLVQDSSKRAAAASVLASLPALEQCERVGELADLGPEPEHAREQRRGLWRELEDAQARAQLGEHVAAASLLAGASRRAQAEGLDELLAELQVARGTSAIAAGDREAGREWVERGLAQALRRGEARTSARAAQILLMLASTSTELAWAERARAWHDRLGTPALERSGLELDEARALARLGEHEAAYAQLQALLVTLGEGQGELGPRRAQWAVELRIELGRLEARLGNLDAARRELEAARRLVDARLGGGHPANRALARELEAMSQGSEAEASGELAP